MPPRSYTGSYTGSSVSKRPRPQRSLGGSEFTQTRPRLLDRPCISRLMVTALLALLVIGILGVIISCIVLSGFARLPEMCLAQAFLFFACCLSLIYLVLHLVAATRNLPVDRQRALQHPLQSWATVVARIALVFWVLSVIAVPASFAKLDKNAGVDLRPGHVDVVVCIFGLISMSIVTFIIEYSDMPFTLPRVTPEHIKCRLSSLGVDEEAFEKSVSRHCSAEMVSEKPKATKVQTDYSRHPTAQKKIHKAAFERHVKPTRSSPPRDEKMSRVVSSPLGPRPMPSTIPEVRKPPPAFKPTTPAERSPPLRKPLPQVVVMPEEPKPAYVGLQAEGWKTQWSELKAEADITSQGSSPTVTPATSVPANSCPQVRQAPSIETLRQQQNEKISQRLPRMPRGQPIRNSRYASQVARPPYLPKQPYPTNPHQYPQPRRAGESERTSKMPVRVHQSAPPSLPDGHKMPPPMMAARMDTRPRMMPTGAIPGGYHGQVFEQATRKWKVDDYVAGMGDGLHRSMVSQNIQQCSNPRVMGGWN